MRIITSKKYLLIPRRIIMDGDCVYFNKSKLLKGITYLESLENVDVDRNTFKNVQLTYIHDISQIPQSDFYSMFDKTIRNSINWCEKKDLKVSFYSSSNISRKVLREFISTLKQTYRAKKIGFKSFDYSLLKSYIKSNALILSVCKGNNDDEIVYHCYKESDIRCILWYSCSSHHHANNKNNVGKINRYLHYRDILFFKERDIAFYDWGGISKSNEEDPIRKFKLSFSGGEIKNVFLYRYINYKRIF